MTGITLSSEQIRSAPTEVRRWIENEIATSLGFQGQAADARPATPQLTAYGYEDLASALSEIQGVFPAVNVFFELGRKGVSLAQDQLQAYRLSDIQHHTRLQSSDQVISCLNFIDEALQRVRGTPGAMFHATHGDYCFVATETQQNIHHLWLELLGRREGGAAAAEGASGDGAGLQEPAPGQDRLMASAGPSSQALQS